MGTVINDAIENAVNEKIQDPAWCSTLVAYLTKIKSGFWDSWYQDMIFQKFDRVSPTLYDAYGFSQIHAWLWTGEVIYAELLLGETPDCDKCIDENNNKLSGLTFPFSGRFWGGTQDEDGVIEVLAPVDFGVAHTVDSEQGVTEQVKGKFPLEVGYIDAGKTFFYLNAYQRIARWPYGSETIYLLYKRTRNSFFEHSFFTMKQNKKSVLNQLSLNLSI